MKKEEKEICHICNNSDVNAICVKCKRPFCETHSAVHTLHNIRDFDCCSECDELMKWGEL